MRVHGDGPRRGGARYEEDFGRLWGWRGEY
jgi:hypothetical protein